MTLPRFLRRSIRAKLMATILAPIIAALIFASVFFPARERALSFELGREQAKTLNEMLAFSVGSGMHGSDFELVQTAFDWAKDDPNVVYVALLDENAEALFEHNPHGLSVDLAAAVSWEEIVEDGSRLYAHTPILYAGTDYGHTVLVYSMGTALTRINWGLALTLIIGLVLALGAALAAGLLSRLIASRLVGLGRAARAVGDGELDAEIPSGSEDEVGPLAEAFRGMVVNIREARTELQTEKDAIEGKVRDAVAESEAERAYLEGEVDRLLTGIESFAEGDLTVTFNAGRDDAIGRLSSGLNRAITQVREMIGEVGRAIDSTAAASTDIGTTTAQLATAAHEQSRQAEEVAAAVEEMARTVSANASTATSTTQVAESNGQAAEEGGAVVGIPSNSLVQSNSSIPHHPPKRRDPAREHAAGGSCACLLFVLS